MVHVNTKVTGLLMSLKTETGNQNRCLTRDIHHKQRERQIDIRREGAIPVRVLLGKEQAARKEERGKMKEEGVRATARVVACLREWK